MRRSRPAVAFDHGNGARQCVSCRHVGVDHSLGLAVVLAHPHLENGPVGVDDGAGHLKAEHLSARDAELHHGLGAASANHVGH